MLTSIDLPFVQGLTVYSSGAFSLDEIRVGETFADVTPATIPVTVDIKPGSETNPVTLIAAEGVLPVAILSDDDFDAMLVDEESVMLGDPELIGAVSPSDSSVEDVDGDGNDDLLLRFSISDLVESLAIDEESVLLALTGETFLHGVSIIGIDLVTIKP